MNLTWKFTLNHSQPVYRYRLFSCWVVFLLIIFFSFTLPFYTSCEFEKWIHLKWMCQGLVLSILKVSLKFFQMKMMRQLREIILTMQKNASYSLINLSLKNTATITFQRLNIGEDCMLKWIIYKFSIFMTKLFLLSLRVKSNLIQHSMKNHSKKCLLFPFLSLLLTVH